MINNKYLVLLVLMLISMISCNKDNVNISITKNADEHALIAKFMINKTAEKTVTFNTESNERYNTLSVYHDNYVISAIPIKGAEKLYSNKLIQVDGNGTAKIVLDSISSNSRVCFVDKTSLLWLTEEVGGKTKISILDDNFNKITSIEVPEIFADGSFLSVEKYVVDGKKYLDYDQLQYDENYGFRYIFQYKDKKITVAKKDVL